ncbi:holin family protein [Roseobacteraceae bacterium NS-SX3]
MGMITGLLDLVFGGGRNALRETIEVFRENAEARAVRQEARHGAALGQFAAEFQPRQKGRFDRFMDGVNRLPRPVLAFGTIGLMAAALTDPVWFAARMQGLALVPEPLWWLLGVIVSFYFGARHQLKAQEFQQGLAQSLARTPQALRNIAALEALAADHPARLAKEAQEDHEALAPEANPALDDWLAARGRAG